jgi:hypothetical protein
MDDLVRWLGEQLDEDERIARAATPGPWEQTPERPGTLASAEYWHVVDCSETPAARENTDHIARHDPARVLREIDAKRRQVEWCVEVIGDRDLSRYDEVGSLKDDRDALAVTLAVETLRLATQPYVDRPGYLAKWAPAE